MPITDFSASADVVGHRVRVRWSLVPGDGEEVLGDRPSVVLRGKDRDFGFDELSDGGVIFDSSTFPPAPTGTGAGALQVDTAALPVEYIDDNRVEVRVTSVRAPVGEQPTVAEPDLVEVPSNWVETMRLTTRSVSDGFGRELAQHVELVDIGADGAGLRSLVPRCYQLESDDGGDPQSERVVAVPTQSHGMSRTMYEMLPTAWRTGDLAPQGVGPGTGSVGAIPESRVDAGPLRRFVDLFGTGGDHLRTRADGLRTLHDVEYVAPQHLGHLAQLVGWDLADGYSIAERRHQIRYAARLYTLTGTSPGVQLWAKRLTSWDVEVHEYHENVLWTNDPGGEDSTTRSGSFTVDTADADLVASLRNANDRGDFTYDTRNTPDARYSPHTVGIFPTFDADDTAADVEIKIDRLLASVDRFLPANLRLVIIVTPPQPSSTAQLALGASAPTETIL